MESGEKFGRDERSQSGAKRAYRRLETGDKACAPVSKFMPPKGTNEISVNRLGLATKAALAELGTRNATRLGKKFWGWYTLTSDDVEAVGCHINPSPFPGNPYHADIIIPVALDAKDRRDDLTEYARDLAYRAIFEPWGKWPG